MASAPASVAEIERKFEPGAGFRMPDLSGLPGVARVSDPVVHELDATYFDTADLRLAANRITLRRRTGGEDAGWHLKLPRGDGDRDELHAPLGRSTTKVPAQLRAPVEVFLRGAELRQVVRLATARTVTTLLDGEGRVLAEVASDEVTATRSAPDGTSATVDAWHEIEVELKAGDRDLLAAAADLLAGAGAAPSDSPSKLTRALGDRRPEVRPGTPRLPDGVAPGSAGAVLLEHLGDHITRLLTNDPLVRADEHDAVHQMRVATRRLRSALATYRPLVDRTVTDPVRDELKWLGEVLGHARDAEVVRDELAQRVAEQPPEVVLGPVTERIAVSLGQRYRTAHDEVVVTLDGVRYFALLDRLDDLLTDPPFTDAARADADDVVLPLVAKTYKRVRKLVDAAAAEPDPHHHDELLHEVRKAAKRARYAGESLVPAYGKPAKAWAAAMEALQEALGEHQDSVVIRAELLALARTAHEAGEDTFTYGRVHAAEQARADATEGRFEQGWKAARKKSLHRWLKG
jgi:CHAD domain-containing protein